MIREIKQAGFQIMIFSGGEPVMRPDIFELVAYATSIGLRAVMGTNATLITPEVAASLKQAGIMAAAVSLDSLDAEKHDKFRGMPDTFNMTLAGIKNLQEAGIPVQINTTVMDWNVEEIEDLCDYAIQLGAVAYHVFFLVPTGRAIDIEEEALRVSAYEKTIVRLMKKQQEVDIEIKPTCAPQFLRIAEMMGMNLRFSRGCLAGISYCIISPKGDVQPCAYLDIPLGNVREKPFDEIWKENDLLINLRTMDYSGKCGLCDYKLKCGGCRARAYYYSHGDYMAEDEWCLYKPKGVRDSE
ncbi:radical sam domain heme biosynthesis protein [hydrocarbon metagenome]|uniref:Radical sam domain heme biosynthesis protein n=1 Tax=hydrocarbon metagenome TaxID=938273 RepID=A0A0W8E8E8_9ZZZZ